MKFDAIGLSIEPRLLSILVVDDDATKKKPAGIYVTFMPRSKVVGFSEVREVYFESSQPEYKTVKKILGLLAFPGMHHKMSMSGKPIKSFEVQGHDDPDFATKLVFFPQYGQEYRVVFKNGDVWDSREEDGPPIGMLDLMSVLRAVAMIGELRLLSTFDPLVSDVIERENSVPALTLGGLRKALDECKDAPDDTPINVNIPISLFGPECGEQAGVASETEGIEVVFAQLFEYDEGGVFEITPKNSRHFPNIVDSKAARER